MDRLKAGDTALIKGIASSQHAAKRLADLGFVPGMRLEMIRPGHPCIVRVNGTCVGLGGAHQASIGLSPLEVS